MNYELFRRRVRENGVDHFVVNMLTCNGACEVLLHHQ